MSSDVLARVDTLTTKVQELYSKGHLLRSAELLGRAAEAARAMGEDNLIAASMRLRQGHALAAHFSHVRANTDPHILAAHRTECVALLSGGVAALERRRMAGRLLEGKCTEAEEVWSAREMQRNNANWTAANAASWSALVGYSEFLNAGTIAVEVLYDARWFAAECSVGQFQAFAQHAVHAVELMQQPRRYGDVAMGVEAKFVAELRFAVAEAGANGLDARLVKFLAGAWERLERSGVLQARRIQERIQFDAPRQQAFHTAVKKSLTAPDRRSCALPGCGAKEAHPAHFKSCAACRTVVYCCREHQVEAWPAHKKACKAARKAAATAEDGAGASGV